MTILTHDAISIAAADEMLDAQRGRTFCQTVSRMEVRCGWCNKHIGWKPCAPEMAGKISHGICTDCEKKLRKEIEEKPVRLGPADADLEAWFDDDPNYRRYLADAAALVGAPDDFAEAVKDLAQNGIRYVKSGIDWASVEDEPWE